MMNILAVTNFPSARHANAAIFFRDTLVRVRDAGHAVTVLAPRVWVPWPLGYHPRWRPYLKEVYFEEQLGLPVYRPGFPRPPGVWYLTREGRIMSAAARRLARRLHRERPFDVVIGYNVMPYGDCAVRLARSLGVPSICVAIGSDLHDFPKRNEATASLARWVVTNANHVLCNSDELRQVALSFGAAPDACTTYYKGIDLEAFRSLPSREDARKRLDLPTDAKIITYAGRLMRAKGVFELVDAFAAIGADPSWRLVMVGEPIAMDALRQRVSAAKLDDRVMIRSMVPRSDIPSYLAASDIFCLPSHNEGVSNAVLEAMAAGLPVVTTTVGGMPEVVTHGATGLLVAPQDPSALASALRELMTDAELAARIGRAARQEAANRFDTARNVQRLIELLDAVRRSRSAPSRSAAPSGNQADPIVSSTTANDR